MGIMRQGNFDEIGKASFDLGSFLSDTGDFFTDDIMDYAGPILGTVGTALGGPIGGAIGGALGSALGSRSAVSDASDAMAGSAQQAADTNWAQYVQSRQDNLPWLRGGYTGLSRLTGMTPEQLADPNAPLATEGGLLDGPSMEDFEASPYYKYAREEQVRDTTRALGGQGLYGASLEAIPETVNRNVMGNYGNFVNDWLATKLNPAQSMAGLGQTTGMGLGAQGINTGAYMGSAYMNAGNARASGYMGQNTAINQGLQGVGDYLAGSGAGQAISRGLGNAWDTVSGWFGGGQATNANQYNDPTAFDPQWNPTWGLG